MASVCSSHVSAIRVVAVKSHFANHIHIMHMAERQQYFTTDGR